MSGRRHEAGLHSRSRNTLAHQAERGRQSHARKRRREFGFERLEDRQVMAYSAELLLDIGWMTMDSTPDDLTVSGDYLYFTSSDSYSTKGALWRTDGSENGTIRLKDFQYQGVVRNLVGANDHLFFTWYLPGVGEQPWKSDGTPEGTVLGSVGKAYEHMRRR